MAEWADKAVCYRWMHERTERIFKTKDMGFMFPVIILSTITGAANFALDSYITNPDDKKNAQLALGTLSIVTGIISTIANRLGYASGAEAHKSAAIQWGKFQRLIAIELSLHPNERSDCMMFLKMCRTDLDRLIEQSPTIPSNVIDACRSEFKQYPNVRKPEIVGDIDTTHIFVDTNSRLKEIARESAITIAQKKGILKQIVLDDLEPRIQRVIDHSTLPSVKEELRKEVQKAAEKATREAVAAVAASRMTAAAATGGGGQAIVLAAPTLEQQAAERKQEVQSVAMTGVVSEMRRRLAEANIQTGRAPAGVGALFAGLPSPRLQGASLTDIVVHVKDEPHPLQVVDEEDEAHKTVSDDESESEGEEANDGEKK